MKKLVLIAFCLAGLSAHSFGQVTLELVNPLTNTSTVVLTAGGSFSLNFEVMGPTTTPALDSFDVTLSGSTTSTTALPTGITLTGFSNLVSGFEGAQGGLSNPDYFGAIADSSPSDDLSFSLTPATILTANFTTSGTLATGTYAIDFPPAGTFQNLFAANGDTISYNPIDATIVVASIPEPQSVGFLLMGLPMAIGLCFLKRFHSSL